MNIVLSWSSSVPVMMILPYDFNFVHCLRMYSKSMYITNPCDNFFNIREAQYCTCTFSSCFWSWIVISKKQCYQTPVPVWQFFEHKGSSVLYMHILVPFLKLVSDFQKAVLSDSSPAPVKDVHPVFHLRHSFLLNCYPRCLGSSSILRFRKVKYDVRILGT